MKKIRSKKGFTLIEVLLAVCILVIGSTMMINGFMATMKYSHNTSVYVRTAAENYDKAINFVSSYSAMEKYAYTTIKDPVMNTDKTPKTVIKFSNCPGYPAGNVGSIGVTISKNDKIVASPSPAPHYFNNPSKGGEQYDPAGDGSYSNNRTSFYYVPEHNYNKAGGNKGKIKVYYNNDDGEYYWKDSAGSDTWKITY